MKRDAYDVIVVGAGLLGSMTALELAVNGKCVLLIDNGLKGASTNNAGFLTYGSFEEYLATEKVLGKRKAREILTNRLDGIRLFYDEYNKYDKYCIIPSCREGLEVVRADPGGVNYAKELESRDMERYYTVVTAPKGLNLKYQYIKNRFEHMIDPVKVLQHLHKTCKLNSVTFLDGEVKAIHDWNVELKDGRRLEYNNLVVCTNAFTSKLLPEYGNITPGRGQVYVTKPLKKQNPVYCPTHYDKGYVYFRPVIGNRVLIGGGRNQSFSTENTLEFENTDKIKDYLLSVLSDITQEQIEIDYGWSGIMAFTPNSRPVVEKVPHRTNVYVGMCCNGMGIALSRPTSMDLARMVMRG